MGYVNIDAIMAEIDKLKGKVSDNSSYCNGWQQALRMLELSFGSFEIKETDLESEQRMRDCPYRQVGCTMYADKILECTGACSWVVDYLNLKKLESQKGE